MSHHEFYEIDPLFTQQIENDNPLSFLSFDAAKPKFGMNSCSSFYHYQNQFIMNNLSSSSRQNNNNSNINSQFNCPNCWGFQQWDDRYQTASIVLSSPPVATERRDSFIRKFMIKYIIGVR